MASRSSSRINARTGSDPTPQHLWWTLSLVVLLSMASACSQQEAHTNDVECQDDVSLIVIDSPLRRKLDLLFVIDNSSSMCQEQAALVKAFPDWVKQLTTYVDLDIHIAVTTTDAVGDQRGPQISIRASSWVSLHRILVERAGERGGIQISAAFQNARFRSSSSCKQSSPFEQ